MEISVHRHPSEGGSTISDVYIGSRWQCVFIEDQVREVVGVPVTEWKIPGTTAIPSGRYRVTLTMSNRFKRIMPLLNNVPGFSGIRIHPGNTAADTEGCLLPGTSVGADDRMVVGSRVAYAALYAKIEAAINDGEEVWMEIG
jgi:Family of unknown function (DUF5675)